MFYLSLIHIYLPGGQAVILAGKGDLSGELGGKELAFGVLKNEIGRASWRERV